ncbi:hypothetical protein NDU88_011816 [Pleurodeles waltl]|uniref:Uncharacterized protein n=1 Tax=Pleurodeles waltl TaxID=8319 RepID=A0AAV7QZV1_PLEWA|nr:hypothetical protein NDU88_011816 [Pleurodeles waltl]
MESFLGRRDGHPLAVAALEERELPGIDPHRAPCSGKEERLSQTPLPLEIAYGGTYTKHTDTGRCGVYCPPRWVRAPALDPSVAWEMLEAVLFHRIAWPTRQ